MRLCIYNVTDGETLYNHLPLLIGDIENCTEDGHIDVWNTSYSKCERIRWPVVEGTFKILVRLKLGENLIHIKYEKETLIFKLNREKTNFKYFVRPVYIICEDDDGYFQGPDNEDCSPQSAQDRIITGAMLIQTFTSENLKEHGLGRYTFQLETNQSNEPLCHIFRSKLTVEKAHSMMGGDLWNHFAKELMESNLNNKDICKWYCFMSFTQYRPPDGVAHPKTHSEILKYTKGHTALGGGGLALFGTGNLHTWARHISEIHSRFTDTRKIDRKVLMDDSAYREFYWANYATGLGASLHELGHTFNLAHTPTGIMARGFDDFNKVFTVQRSKKNINSSKNSLPRNRSNESIDGSPLKNHGSPLHGDMIPLKNNESPLHRDMPPLKINTSSMKRDTSSIERDTSPLKKDSQIKVNKDVCYGSPLRKIKHSSRSDTSYTEPVVVKVESNFKPMKSPSTMIISMKNYDGTQNLQHIAQDSGYETVTDMLLGSDGQLLAKTFRKERRTGSCSSSMTCSSESTPPSPIATVPSLLPNSPEEPLIIPKLAFKYGGAHWYRSSAVLLRFHKWFNGPDLSESKEAPTLAGSKIKSLHGLRLVELWKEPDGVVFYHWEFIKKAPPIEFTLKLSEIKDMPPDVTVFTVQAEDNHGNVMRKKIKKEDFEN